MEPDCAGTQRATGTGQPDWAPHGNASALPPDAPSYRIANTPTTTFTTKPPSQPPPEHSISNPRHRHRHSQCPTPPFIYSSPQVIRPFPSPVHFLHPHLYNCGFCGPIFLVRAPSSQLGFVGWVGGDVL